MSIRRTAEKVFKEEALFASHLGLQAVICPAPDLESPNYYRCLNQVVLSTIYQQFWVRIPMIYENRRQCTVEEDDYQRLPWISWNNLITAVDMHQRVGIALEIAREEDIESVDDFKRWLSEPVKAIIIKLSQFVINNKGFPVLCRKHQEILRLFMKSKLHVILSGCPSTDGNISLYVEYIRHLQRKFNSSHDASFEERFTSDYKDVLQV